ncbi:LLM class flavin-dependent oxidoreductase [Paenibacillus sp. GCM10012307]|uniref:LLM class flavin-dependent oxidoreductase n=1 Tax=Paenibacillus roseus TaxID=2798579 RepID=A0A934J3T7_9BACL|nr:LLM class flavin-dependent oxidoreductase [Paenibacillus roseus]MBJ6359915.1 LLM class flavin-dependent oxidoreductase [Paenibacillus roseus]
MSKEKRQMSLGAMLFYPAGEHIASWRHPQAEADKLMDFEYYKRFIQTAERGKFDLFFYADEVYLWDRFESGISHANTIRPEPFTLLSALSVVTEHIGLAATISTTYNEPYHIARKLATLDYLSKGRAAWNIVTSQADEEARNFGKEKHMDHSERYERAKEFIDVTQGLWDSWEDDALLFDKESGYFADINKLHNLDYKGKHFSVRGPLNVSRPPQGYPVLIQAGASDAGKELAAAKAEVVFGPGGPIENAISLYEDLKGRMAKYGRERDELKILPAVSAVVGRTEAEAQEKLAIIEGLAPVRLGLDLLSHFLGRDISDLPLDEPLPFIPEIEGFNQSKSALERLRQMVTEEKLTVRELARRFTNRKSVVGTPEQIADYLEEWFVKGAADGFNLVFPHLPGCLDDFVDLVVPELQRRGLFRTEYTGNTLREHFQLQRPASRFVNGRS